MPEKTSRFLHFILGLLVADLIYSLLFYLREEVVKINNYIIQPNFFLFVAFMDIIVIAIIVKTINRR